MALLIDQYFDPGMAQALRVLGKWKQDKGEGFAKVWSDDLDEVRVVDEARRAEAQVIDDARRKVKGFFHKVAKLHFAGVIRASTVREIVYVAGLNIYLDVIDPMELALNPSRRPRTYEFLKAQFGRYTEAEKIRPVPPRQSTTA